MTCREFEDAMREQFGTVDRDHWRPLLLREEWDLLPPTQYTEHLARCKDCLTSLWQFFDVRDTLNYHTHPCFHLAYFSADGPNRCIEEQLGLYTVAIVNDPEKGKGVVIGFCPWCGMALQTGITS